jgi:hypothetical protein
MRLEFSYLAESINRLRKNRPVLFLLNASPYGQFIEGRKSAIPPGKQGNLALALFLSA